MASISRQSYEYMPLQNAHRDIRLFDLFPGDFDDELRISIYQAHLPQPPTSAQRHGQDRLSLADLARSLPEGWEIHETLSGRYIFWQRSTNLTTWVHPDLQVTRESYEWWAGARPSYEAVSYTWGSIDNPATVSVERLDGEFADIDLLIPPNLALALRHFRYRDRTRTLWADSISINQNNLPERNSHVKRMADIYRLAYRVLVWLGPSSSNSHLAIRSLRRYAAQVDYTFSRHRLSAPGAAHQNWSSDASHVPFDLSVWQSILDLIGRSWFDRLWIMQEIQLASHLSTIHCGPDHIDWPNFRKAIMCLRDLPGVSLEGWVSSFIGIERLIAPVANLDLLILLSRAHQRLCADQREKVYGVLSLASPQLLSRITPDYAKSVSAIYVDAFLAIVEQTNRLEILPYCIEKSKPLPGLPSWCPDWTTFPRAPLGHRITYNMHTLVAGHTSPSIELLSGNVLKVAAVKLGVIQHVYGPAPVSEEEGLKALADWAPPDPIYAPTGQDAADAFTLTLLHCRVDERYHYWPVTPGRVLPLAQQKEAIYDQIRRGRPLSAEHRTDMQEPLYKIHERIFFTADGGYFGLAPGTAKKGDIFCVVLGCDEIMLLREIAADRFRVIGPTYVHGLWDGEGILGPVNEPWKVKYIKDKTGVDTPRFLNQDTGELSFSDPRLGPLPKHWSQSVLDRSTEDPLSMAWFRNEQSGEVSNQDPRVSLNRLNARGVNVRSYLLV